MLSNHAAVEEMQRSGDRRPFPLRSAFGAFAVAWHRSVAKRMLELHVSMNVALDSSAMHAVAQEAPGQTLVFWPYLMAPDLRDSSLRAVDDEGFRRFHARCRWNFSAHDMSELDSSGPWPLSVLGSAALEGGWGRSARNLMAST